MSHTTGASRRAGVYAGLCVFISDHLADSITYESIPVTTLDTDTGIFQGLRNTSDSKFPTPRFGSQFNLPVQEFNSGSKIAVLGQ